MTEVLAVISFRERYSEAIHARLAGNLATVGMEEWVGGIVSLLPKILSAIAVTLGR